MGIDEAHRQDIKLLTELGIEVTPGLIIGECLVPIGRSLKRIPPNENGPRAFVFVETQQKIREADDGSGTLVASTSDRLRERVIGSMRKGIAVDHKQRPPHDRPSTSVRRWSHRITPSWSFTGLH